MFIMYFTIQNIFKRKTYSKYAMLYKNGKIFAGLQKRGCLGGGMCAEVWVWVSWAEQADCSDGWRHGGGYGHTEHSGGLNVAWYGMVWYVAWCGMVWVLVSWAEQSDCSDGWTHVVAMVTLNSGVGAG